MVRTKNYFNMSKNDCGELLFTCRKCGSEWVEHDGDMIRDRELLEHIAECVVECTSQAGR